MNLENRNWKLVLPVFLLLIFPMVGNAVEGVRLVCDEPVYNFGHVTQSAVITNVFTVRNEGDLSFMLKYVHTSCRPCTKRFAAKALRKKA